MIRILTILAFFMAFLAPIHTWAVVKKTNKDEVRPTMPVPDARLHPQRPHRPLAPVGELGKPVVLEMTYSHTASERGGIDVSHYQGQINWKTVAHDGRVLYAYCKATENTSVFDNTFLYNVREARKNGVPVGAYHFFRPNVSGEEQLKFFLENVDMKTQDLIPMLDIEIRGKASLPVFHKQIRAWLEGFEKIYHYKPIIYASVNFYNKYLAGYFDDYKYMVAKYSEDIPTPDGPMKMVMWQYTANGRVDGIRGAVDQSRFCDKFDLKDILIKK